MTYIGQQPATTFDAGIQDRFTGLSTNTVTLTHEIAAEEDILVVWNNIVQDKNTYSVGGTGNKTLTLGGTLVSADVVTVYYLNKVMQSVNPTAASVNTTQLADLGVTGAKLNTDVISAQTALGATPADTDELLVSDAGVLKRVDYSYLKGGANTPAFLASLSGDKGTYSAGATTKVQFDNQIIDTDDAYDPSTNYRFTVPSGAAGNYMINISLDIQSTTNGRATNVSIYKNGGVITTGGYFLSSQYFQNDQPSTNTISQVLNLSDGDYIEAYGFMYDGGNHTFKATRSFFSGYKLIT